MKRAICITMIAAILVGNLVGCANTPIHYRDFFPQHWLDRPAFDGADQTLRDSIREIVLIEHPELIDDEVALEAKITEYYDEYAVDIQKAQRAASRLQTRLQAAQALGMLLRGLLGGGAFNQAEADRIVDEIAQAGAAG